ncbi:MAG: ABC transporter ATP-binding protein [Bacteroidales bacterium]|jgi:ATP-binding cassette subfamily B multidrug efflux pump
MILRYAKKYSALIVGQLFFATVWVLSQLAIPRLMVDIIDYGIMVNDMSQVVQRGMLMLLATVVNIVSLLISLYYLTRVTAGISRDLRGDLFERIIDWSKQTRGGFSNSTLITRTVNDVKQVSILIDMSLRKIYTLTITVIGAVIISFSIDAKMASIILVIIPVIFILALRLTSKALPKYSSIREAIDQMNQRFRENVTGIRVVKAFNKSGYETKKFREATKEACQANVRAESTMMLLSPLVLLFTNILILILLYMGGVRAVLGTITVGALIGLIEYAIMALNNIQQFASIITIFPRSKVSIDRIQEILSTEEVLQIRETTEGLKENVLRFNDIDFYYPNSNAAVLHDIHFELNKGETKAVIGSTGSGKSTLIRLMMRDYDAYRGQISYNGQDITSLSNTEINHIITHIPQTTFLFSGTIRENLQTGKKEATDDEIWEVLDMVQMGDFFRQAEEGLDFYIAQNAVNLSGGQKQRISIARGLIRETDFYLFDDCFSALDYSTEKKVRQAIQKKLSDKGVLVIAQRVATVKDADEILVIDNGKIVGRGSHRELEERCPVYQEIIASQKRIDKGGAK